MKQIVKEETKDYHLFEASCILFLSVQEIQLNVNGSKDIVAAYINNLNQHVFNWMKKVYGVAPKEICEELEVNILHHYDYNHYDKGLE